VFQIGPEAHPDEVRDLFIRLQSGTALTRQQIRDAWPGNLGPFIEALAGKLDRKPSIVLFKLVDKRGQRSDDDEQRDAFVADRQLCAQLFKIFMARAVDPYAYPSVSANELDSVYHEFTDFDPRGDAAARFRKTLEDTTAVFIAAVGLRKKVKIKVRLLDIRAVVMFAQDAARDPQFKLNASALAQRIVNSDDQEKPAGRSTSSSTLKKYYEWWRENVAIDVGVRLDPNRAFESTQKAEIRTRDGDRCGVCQLEVVEADAEYDHFPVPWRDGGRTSPDNGRLVHRACHPRGRPLES
jgi:HNH endonuclease